MCTFVAWVGVPWLVMCMRSCTSNVQFDGINQSSCSSLPRYRSRDIAKVRGLQVVAMAPSSRNASSGYTAAAHCYVCATAAFGTNLDTLTTVFSGRS
jgi:hypothetical protein